MAWEGPLDRLLLRQIHLAENGEAKSSEVREEIVDLLDLSGKRPQSYFHVGYAGTLLGLKWRDDTLDSVANPVAARWFTFGKLRAHDRRGERSWVSELCEDPQVLADLLREPVIAAQCLPIVVRNFFWSGALDRAAATLELLAYEIVQGEDGIESQRMLLEAGLSDLISRIEKRADEIDEETDTRSILSRCVQIPGFDELMPALRARYQRALAKVYLASGEWDEVERCVQDALDHVPNTGRLASSVMCVGALGRMRAHQLHDLVPEPNRADREDALELLNEALADEQRADPDAYYARGVLSYECSRFEGSCDDFDRALKLCRGAPNADDALLARARFYLGAGLLASGAKDEGRRAARLVAQALDTVQPDLETFYRVHDALKEVDRQAALRFLDRIDVGRGASPEQLLIVALEYQSLGEATAAERASERVLKIATDLDQRVEALKVVLTARNMRGEDEAARDAFYEIRDLYLRRGKFEELEALLKDEALVGQALDHIEIKNELIDLFDEMEDHDEERVALQLAVARSFRAHKEVDQLKQALMLLREVEVRYPELAKEDLETVQKLLVLAGANEAEVTEEQAIIDRLTATLGRPPRVLVVGGNERQRKHHPKFDGLKREWGIDGEWLMANYTSPQRLVNQIGERIQGDLDFLVLLHWNRHETTEPSLELARKAGVTARTVYYAGFTSLRIALVEMFSRATEPAAQSV